MLYSRKKHNIFEQYSPLVLINIILLGNIWTLLNVTAFVQGSYI